MSSEDSKGDAPVWKHEKFVLAKCKRGSDRATEGQSCRSTSAYQTTPPGGSAVGFRCALCGYSWTVVTGGAYTY